jgi:hypothetical protein
LFCLNICSGKTVVVAFVFVVVYVVVAVVTIVHVNAAGDAFVVVSVVVPNCSFLLFLVLFEK